MDDITKYLDWLEDRVQAGDANVSVYKYPVANSSKIPYFVILPFQINSTPQNNQQVKLTYTFSVTEYYPINTANLSDTETRFNKALQGFIDEMAKQENRRTGLEAQQDIVSMGNIDLGEETREVTSRFARVLVTIKRNK